MKKIIVGDVHGCYNSLKEVLAKAELDQAVHGVVGVDAADAFDLNARDGLLVRHDGKRLQKRVRQRHLFGRLGDLDQIRIHLFFVHSCTAPSSSKIPMPESVRAYFSFR